MTAQKGIERTGPLPMPTNSVEGKQSKLRVSAVAERGGVADAESRSASCRAREPWGILLILAAVVSACAGEERPARANFARVRLVRSQATEQSTTVDVERSNAKWRSPDYMKAAMLVPVLESLKRKLANDAELLALVDRVVLNVSDQRFLSANAQVTWRPCDSPAIAFDFMFVAKNLPVAMLGVFVQSDPQSLKRAFETLCAPYARDLMTARQQGSTSPPPFLIDESLIRPSDLNLLSTLAMAHNRDFTAWLLLHEVAHLRPSQEPASRPLCNEGDTDATDAGVVTTKSFEESQARELAADAWATRKLIELEYGVISVESTLVALGALESLQAHFQYVMPPSVNPYPSWRDRKRSFETVVESVDPPPKQWVSYQLLTIPFGDAAAAAASALFFWLPIDTEGEGNTGYMGSVALDGTSLQLPSFVGVELVGSELFAYSRLEIPAAPITTYRFETPTKHTTRVHVSSRGRPETIHLMFRGNSHGGLGLGGVGWLPEPSKLLKEQVAQAGLSEGDQAMVIRANSDALSRWGRLLLNYTKGNLSVEDYRQQKSRVGEQLQSYLKRSLGVSAYQRLVNAEQRLQEEAKRSASQVALPKSR